MHGWWWSGRQIVPILPLGVSAVAVLVDRVRPLLWPTVGLGLIGLFNWSWIAIEASTGRRALIVDHEDTSNPVFHGWKQLLPDHRVDALGDQIITTVWAVLFAATAMWAWRAARTVDRLLGDQDA